MKRSMIGGLLALVLAGCGGSSAATTHKKLDTWMHAVIVRDWATATSLMSGDIFSWQDRAENISHGAPWTDAQMVIGPQPWAGQGQEVVIQWSRPDPKPEVRVRCTRIVIVADGTIQGDDQFVDCPGQSATP